MKKRSIYRKSGFRNLLLLGIAVLLPLALLSCPNPIEQSLIDYANDKTPPTITIPVPPTEYTNSVTVDGTVTDVTNTKDAVGEIDAFSYEIVGTNKTGTITVAADGTFTVSIDTKELSGEISIILTAMDWNGNITTYTLEITDEEFGPNVTYTKPADQSFYASAVVVEGTVSNSDTDEKFDQVKSLSYEVLSSSISGDLTFEEGIFSFMFTTSDLDGNIVVRVIAEDYNQNTSTTDITLLDAGIGIPVFSAESGNGQVTLSWDDVPLSESYDLFYTANDSIPSETNGTTIAGVTSPYTLSGLTNGTIHSLKLKSNSLSGDDNWSGVINAAPLSEFSLAPIVTSEADHLQVKWPEIIGWESYTVYRSSSRDGTYADISGEVDRTEFNDSNVTAGTDYFYKVKPSLDGCSLSASTWGRMTETPQYIEGIVGAAQVPESTNSTPGSDRLVRVGDTAYGIMRDLDFRVFDITDPFNPSITDSYDYDTQTSDDVAHIYGDYTGVTIDGWGPLSYTDFDWSKGFYYYDLAVSGNHAYAIGDIGNNIEAWPNEDAYWHNGIHIYNISDPNNIQLYNMITSVTAPEITDGTYEAPEEEQYTDVAAGSSMLCSVITNKVHLFDVSNVSEPEWKDSLSSPQTFQDIIIDGNYLYVVSGTGGGGTYRLNIYDISEQSFSLQTTTACTLDYTPTDIVIDGNYAYIAERNNAGTFALQIVDISDKNSPLAEKAKIISEISGSFMINDMKIHYGYLLLAVEGEILIINLDTVSNPYLSGRYSNWSVSDFAITAKEGYMYLLANKRQPFFYTLDLTNQALPEALDNGVPMDYGGSANDVFVDGHYAYIAAGQEGLVIADLADITNPSIEGWYPTSDARAVFAASGYCLLADGSDGLYLIDVSDPASPSGIDSLSLSGTPQELLLWGNYIYVSAGTSGLYVIDISDPQNMSLVTTIPTTYAKGMYIESNISGLEGTYLYLADGNNSVNVYDITDKSSPTRIGKANLSNTPHSVLQSGHFLMIGEDSKIETYLVTSPNNPTPVGGLDFTHYYPGETAIAYDSISFGGFMFSAHKNAFSVLDVSNLMTPILIGTYKTGSDCMGVARYEDYILLANSTGGLRIIDPWPGQ